MVNMNVRALLFLSVTMLSVGCGAPTDEHDEGIGAPGEALSSEELAAHGSQAGPEWAGPTGAEADWAGPTDVGEASSALACTPRIEASNWYCCGRFRECKVVYICEYCANSKSCYQQGGVWERSSPGCY